LHPLLEQIDMLAAFAWGVIAIASIVISVLTLQLMYQEISAHPAALRVPQIRTMKYHDLVAQMLRLVASTIAFIIIVGLIWNWLSLGQVVWLLVTRALLFMVTSVTEFLTTSRLLTTESSHYEERALPKENSRFQEPTVG